MNRQVDNRRSRPPMGSVATLLAFTVGAFVLGACSTGPSGSSDRGVPPTLTPLPPSTPVLSSPVGSPLGGAQPPEGFRMVTVAVEQADGTVTTYCLWLAETDAERQRGLMGVTDPSLGGRPGMLFSFDREQSGGFWMKNTPLPLSIAYVADDGSVVATNDMEPCLDATATCPTYPSPNPYRYAVEVPKGQLASVGLATPRARLSVRDKAC